MLLTQKSLAQGKEMNIHKMNPNQDPENAGPTDSAGTITGVVGYTAGQSLQSGSHFPNNIDPESNDCYAKRIEISTKGLDSKDKSKYYIKFGISGLMYNPWGIYSEGTQNKEAKHAGRMAWVFKRVNKKAFGYYIEFLMSKNQAWLNNAEREARNGEPE